MSKKKKSKAKKKSKKKSKKKARKVTITIKMPRLVRGQAKLPSP